jgi:parallel beta-helix repeat protein
MFMRRKAFVLTLISLLLSSAIVVKLCVRFASAQTSSVIITVEGFINPPTASIQQAEGIYTLTDNIGEIWIGRSNITLNGNGYKVTKTLSPFAEKRVNLYSVKNVTIKNLTIEGGPYGIFLDGASNVTLSNNTVEGTSVPFPQSQGTGGIYVSGGGNNRIVGNCLENNVWGLSLVNSNGRNTISENNITSSYAALWIYKASNNTIYHNNFINNSNSVADVGVGLMPSVNIWDGGLFSGGNFWSDYDGTDENGDGIGDNPYKVNDNNRDLYPLMKPWHPTIPFDDVPPLIFISSPVHRFYNESSVQLNFSICESSSSMSYSLDGQENVTIAGNTTLSELPNGSHYLLVYVTDRSGNIGSSETIFFTVEVPEPFPIAIVAAASVATAAVVGAGLLVCFKKRHIKSGVKRE